MSWGSNPEPPEHPPGVPSWKRPAPAPTPSPGTQSRRQMIVLAGGSFALIVGFFIFFAWGPIFSAGDPTYVSQCRSLWWNHDGRNYPAVEVSYQRNSDDRTVGYYTDFIITLKFDNFGKHGRIHLQCAANLQKTFVYMQTDDSDWIGGAEGPSGVAFTLANGQWSLTPPRLE